MKLKSKIYHANKRPGQVEALDGNELFEEAEKIVNDVKNKLGWTKTPRHFQPQTLLNRHSAGYLSPTAMKSFLNCPAHYMYGMVEPIDRQRATYVGTAFHMVMQEFYQLDSDKRDKQHLDEIKDRIIVEEQIEGYALNSLNSYVEGFWSAPDYLRGPNGELLPMDHSSIKNELEYFVRDALTPLGINMSEDPHNIPSVPTYTLIDRIDFRDDGVYIIDYKTGFGNAEAKNLGINGYLSQLIYYKWAIEKIFNIEVKGAYLMLPGANDEEHKWEKLNIHSLKNQSITIERSVDFLSKMAKVRDSRMFPILQGPYCRPFDFKTEEVLIEGENVTREYLDVDLDIDEREFLETALSDGTILELPDEIQTLDQWVEFAKNNNHLVENEDALIDEYKLIRSKNDQSAIQDIFDEGEDEDW